MVKATGITLDAADSNLYAWDDSTYINNPPYFEGMSAEVSDVSDIHAARVLAYLGDSVTTDHISPAGAIAPDSPCSKIFDRKRRKILQTSIPTVHVAVTTK